MATCLRFTAVVCFFICCISCIETSHSSTESAGRPNTADLQERKPTDEETVLRLMLADALKQQHRLFVEWLSLDIKIATVAFIDHELRWPRAVATSPVFDSYEHLYNNQGLYERPILGIRLDKLELKSQPGMWGNCKITFVLFDSDDRPRRSLPLGYGAEKIGDSWKVELVSIG